MQQFLVRIGIAFLDRPCALQDPHRFAHTAQLFDFGDVDRVLEDQFDPARLIQERGVGGAPVMGVEAAALVGDIVTDMGDFVRSAGFQHPIERCA